MKDAIVTQLKSNKKRPLIVDILAVFKFEAMFEQLAT